MSCSSIISSGGGGGAPSFGPSPGLDVEAGDGEGRDGLADGGGGAAAGTAAGLSGLGFFFALL